MSKKYTAKEIRAILADVLCGALEHMEAIKKELVKLDSEDISQDPNKLARQKTLTLTMTLINDIIHPAHPICYQIFKGAEDVLNLYVRNHKLAIEHKLVPECHCHTCYRPEKGASLNAES